MLYTCTDFAMKSTRRMASAGSGLPVAGSMSSMTARWKQVDEGLGMLDQVAWLAQALQWSD